MSFDNPFADILESLLSEREGFLLLVCGYVLIRLSYLNHFHRQSRFYLKKTENHHLPVMFSHFFPIGHLSHDGIAAVEFKRFWYWKTDLFHLLRLGCFSYFGVFSLMFSHSFGWLLYTVFCLEEDNRSGLICCFSFTGHFSNFSACFSFLDRFSNRFSLS